MSVGKLPNGAVPVLLSAVSEELLGQEAAAILEYLQRHEAATVEETSETLRAARALRRCRMLVAADSRDGLLAALAACARGEEHPAVATATVSPAPKIAFVFPGQGGQRPGMGQLFYARSAVFRAESDRCEEVFQELFGLSPLDYLLDRGAGEERGAGASIVQSALFTQMAGLAAMWRALGVAPQVTVGHSLGEIAAAYVAGAITLRDAARVIVLRAETAARLPVGGFAMAMLGVSLATCEQLLASRAGWAQVSVVNEANLIGVSGDPDTVAQIAEEVRATGAFVRQLQDPYPAHITHFDQHKADFVRSLAAQLEHREIAESPILCVASATGQALGPETDLCEHWFQNVRDVVRFDRAVETAVALGTTLFVEIAEHPTLAVAMRETIDAARAEGSEDSQQPVVVGTSRRTATDFAEFERNAALVMASDPDGLGWSALPTVQPLAQLRGFPNAPMRETVLWAELCRGEHAIRQQPEPSPAPAPAKAPAPQGLAKNRQELLRKRLLERGLAGPGSGASAKAPASAPREAAARSRPSTGWIRQYHSPSAGQARQLPLILLFPHAGSGASSYRGLSQALSKHFEPVVVQYPGRQDRLREAVPATLQEFGAAVFEEFQNSAAAARVPVALFGHSMGALVAFEFACLAEAAGLALTGLFASGVPAPWLHGSLPDFPQEDQALLAQLNWLNGTEESIMQNQEILSMALSATKADYSAINAYARTKDARLRTPIHTFAGSEDPLVAVEQVRAWADHAERWVETVEFPGGHFFVQEDPRAVAEAIRAALTGARA